METKNVIICIYGLKRRGREREKDRFVVVTVKVWRLYPSRMSQM